MFNFIKHPITDNWVDIKSKTGINIINNYKKQIGGLNYNKNYNKNNFCLTTRVNLREKKNNSYKKNLEKSQKNRDNIKQIKSKLDIWNIFKELLDVNPNVIKPYLMQGKYSIAIQGEALNIDKKNKIKLFHIGDNKLGKVKYIPKKKLYPAIDIGGLTNASIQDLENYNWEKFDSQTILKKWISLFKNLEIWNKTNSKMYKEWEIKAIKALNSITDAFKPDTIKICFYIPISSRPNVDTSVGSHIRLIVKNSDLYTYGLDKTTVIYAYGNNITSSSVLKRDSDTYSAIYWDTRPGKGWTILSNINMYNINLEYLELILDSSRKTVRLPDNMPVNLKNSINNRSNLVKFFTSRNPYVDILYNKFIDLL